MAGSFHHYVGRSKNFAYGAGLGDAQYVLRAFARAVERLAPDALAFFALCLVWAAVFILVLR
jgi:hypothetical protein